MEASLIELLNEVVFSHDNCKAEENKRDLRCAIRVRLENTRIRIVQRDSENEFDEGATIVNVAFYLHGDVIESMKLEINLRRFNDREFLRLEYDPNPNENTLTAIMRPKDESIVKENLKIRKGNIVCDNNVEIYFEGEF